MVKGWRVLFFLILLAFPFQGYSQVAPVIQEVIVESEADQYAVAGKPIQASVTVTHKSDKKIDQNSFKMDDKPLQVEFIKEVKLSDQSDLIISIFHFTIEAKKNGLHYLPPVSVNVGGKVYSSNESTYQVGN